MAARAAALVIVLFAALLRLDALVGKYGTVDHPAWARVATHQVASLATHLRPPGWQWGRVDRPYVGGDPINYLAFARHMESFYQAHVREPVFLASTRIALWLLDGQDVALSLASAAGSVLLVFATYLLGAALWSPAAGLLASLLLALEYEAINWAPDGWRDDTFAAAVVLSAWALLRLYQRPTFWRALAAGVMSGLACLTRVTAVTFVLPAFAWLVAASLAGERKAQLRHVGLALLIATVLVAPYLINCAVATGDPLYALNYHTTYYRFEEGQDISQPMSAAGYLGSKLRSRPVATFEKGFIGLFVWPFATKWNGWDPWLPALRPIVQAAALTGLAVLPFVREGRLLLVILLTSLVPYAFTWDLGSGGSWRFTEHAYAIYLVAAAVAIVGGCAALRGARHASASSLRLALSRAARRAAGAAAVAVTGVALYYWLPWPVVNEAIAAGEATSLDTGPRDRVFYRTGWSPPHDESITVRVSTAAWGVVHFPLPERRAYGLVLRLDPVVPGLRQRVTVLFNRRVVGAWELTWNPDRVGTYRLDLPKDTVRAGGNELAIVPEPTVVAGAAGPRFSWLAPGERIGVRLWYVRVLP